jgi:hypothetical protein
MSRSSARDIVSELGAAEAEIAASLAGDRGSRMAALEYAPNGLLHQFVGHSPRSTDGVLSLYEELTAQRYFLIAKVVMVVDQLAEPLCIALSRNQEGAIADGYILFGLLDRQLPRGINSLEKLEAVLLAYPHEAAEAMPWALRFVRANGRWQLS